MATEWDCKHCKHTPVLLQLPPHISKPCNVRKASINNVSIDACIAEVIAHLWRNEIETFGCCCGHGKARPSIIFEQNLSKQKAAHIRELIAEIDERDFDLLSWSLVVVHEDKVLFY